MNTLLIHPAIEACLRDQVAPGTGISPEQFWNSFAECVHALGPKNLAALQKRNSLQKKIDDFNPDIIFWSAISSHIHGEGEYVNIQYGYELINGIKTSAWLVTGGLQATASPQQILKNLTQSIL